MCCSVFAAVLTVAVPVRAEPTTVPLVVSVKDVVLDTGGALGAKVDVENPSEREASVEVEFSIQRDSSLYDAPIPHPLYGPNLALGARSWAEGKGEQVVE